jgi:hypothetical protein
MRLDSWGRLGGKVGAVQFAQVPRRPETSRSLRYRVTALAGSPYISLRQSRQFPPRADTPSRNVRSRSFITRRASCEGRCLGGARTPNREAREMEMVPL